MTWEPGEHQLVQLLLFIFPVWASGMSWSHWQECESYTFKKTHICIQTSFVSLTLRPSTVHLFFLGFENLNTSHLFVGFRVLVCFITIVWVTSQKLFCMGYTKTNMFRMYHLFWDTRHQRFLSQQNPNVGCVAAPRWIQGQALHVGALLGPQNRRGLKINMARCAFFLSIKCWIFVKTKERHDKSMCWLIMYSIVF